MTFSRVVNKMRQKDTAILTTEHRIHKLNKILVFTRTIQTPNTMITIKKQTPPAVMPIARARLGPLHPGTISSNIISTIKDSTAVTTTHRRNSKTSTIDTAQCRTEAITIHIKNLPTTNLI